MKRLLALLFFWLGGLVALKAETLYQNDFESSPKGPYDEAAVEREWHAPKWTDGVEEGRVDIVADPEDSGNQVLRVRYPKGVFSSGAEWKLAFAEGQQEIYLSYRLRFEEGFQFVLGGKLPGLYGGKGNSGGHPPDGTDGWSARMMWRANGSGHSEAGNGTANLVQYVYHPDQPGKYGDDLKWDDGPERAWVTVTPGRWYRVTHRIVMNTPGKKDGLIQAWLDGKKVLDSAKMRFRDTSDFQIDGLFFSTFFGGGSKEWAARKDEYACFDDFLITTDAALPGVER